MAEYPIFVFIAILILGYGIFSKLADKSIITAPMVFVSVGIIARLITGDSVEIKVTGHLVKIIAELTLILILFIDASTINLKKLIREKSLPLRLLLIGLPLTMLSGVLIAMPLFPEMNTWVLILMALILSPTDAALGQAVVTSKFVPERIRQTINVESGLNDGIVLPPIFICIAALSLHNAHGSGFSYWSVFTLKQFIFGPLIGGIVGWLGGVLVDKASKREWMNSTFQRLASVSIAVLTFSLAEMVHGNGFIAAYFAGLLLGTTTPEIRERIQEFGEAESMALELVIFLLFGFILVPLSYPLWDWRVWLYALLSLTLVRMIPVVISLIGTKLSIGTVVFIGWFGPRGIASVLYLLLVIYLAARYFLKLSKLLFSGLKQGGITISNFDPDWAMPTYKIFRIFVIVFAVVVAYPYIPGSGTSAFKGISVFIGVLFSLGSNFIAGYTITYRGAYKKGDYIQIGDQSGFVQEQEVLVTRMLSIKNEEIVIPNSVLLTSNIINYSTKAKEERLIIHTTVGIGYETPWRMVDAMLKQAVERKEGLLKQPPPFVLKTSLGDFAITYEINACCNDATKLPLLYSELHQNILDVFNENNVQIMTPAYISDPAAPKIVPKDQWDTPLAGEV